MAERNTAPTEVGDALNDAINVPGEPKGPIRDEAKFKQARDAGWVEPQAYDYTAASARHGEQAAPSSIEQVDAEDMPGWMHQAAKYEWHEDYGDIGPEVPELEAQLFKGDSRTRTGQFLDK